MLMVTPLPSLRRLSARSQRMSRANPKWGSSQAIRRPPSGVARHQQRWVRVSALYRPLSEPAVALASGRP